MERELKVLLQESGRDYTMKISKLLFFLLLVITTSGCCFAQSEEQLSVIPAPSTTVTANSYKTDQLAFSPDNQLLASLGFDRTLQSSLKIWKITNDKLSNALKQKDLVRYPVGNAFSHLSYSHFSYIGGIAFSPTGSQLAVGKWDAGTRTHTIEIRDTVSWKIIRKIVIQETSEKCCNFGTRQLAYSPNGAFFAQLDYNSHLRIWRTKDWKLLHVIPISTSIIFSSMSFSPDSETIGIATDDQDVRLWDVQTGQVTKIISKSNGAEPPIIYTCAAIAFSPNGNQLAVAIADAPTFIEDIKTGRIQCKLSNSKSAVRSMSFSPDGTYLVTASLLQPITIWNTLSGKKVKTLTVKIHTYDTHSDVRFSPNGKLLAACGKHGKIEVWDVAKLHL
jgi:WD40 repeat protein